MRPNEAVRTARMDALAATVERESHTVRKTAASSSRDTSKKTFSSDEGPRDLPCSKYERAQDMRLEAKETQAAATDTLFRRAGPSWVAQRAIRTS